VPWFDPPALLPQFPPWMPPVQPDNPIKPLPDADVPYIQAGWTMLSAVHFVVALYAVVEIEEEPDGFFLDDIKEMPHYPVWQPPDEPSFFTQEPEAPHPEVDRIDLPIWLPWRPMPYEDFYTDEPEDVKWLDGPFYMPPAPYFMPPQPEQPGEPIPDNEPFLEDQIVLPLPQPPFMPPHMDFFENTPHPPKCPPPCLRRPDRKC